MIELDEVRSSILAAIDRLPIVEVPSSEALGLVLAADVVSSGPIPPFANTAMDGYAVRAESTAGATADAPVRLRVVESSRRVTPPRFLSAMVKRSAS